MTSARRSSAMKVAILAVALLALAAVADGKRLLRARQLQAQEPDTTCGKGFDNLVAGSQEYFKTALEKLWVHPGRSEQSGTLLRAPRSTSRPRWRSRGCTP